VQTITCGTLPKSFIQIELSHQINVVPFPCSIQKEKKK